VERSPSSAIVGAWVYSKGSGKVEDDTLKAEVGRTYMSIYKK
jgi:hypothetical protein